MVLVITADESDVLSGISKITQNSMMVYASSVIFWIIIALFSARTICKPLRKIVDILADFAKGDFTADIKIHSILKETNQLIGAAINLKENMSASISNVDNSAKNLLRDTDRVNDAINLCNSAAENVNIAVNEISNGAMDLANHAQNINTQMVSVGETISATNDLVISVEAASDQIKTISDTTMDTLESLLNANKVTNTAAEEVAGSVMETNSAVQKISEAATIIASIAEQTNLLSLNASIEAARAGESGRGFAVVAGEIKNLAEQSNGSAKEIKEIIENIIAISERSTASAGAIKEAVSKEKNVLKDMHIDFEKVVKSINDVSAEINEIASKMNEINTSKETIMESTESLSAISEENAASTEETTATITEMTAQISAIDEQMRDVKEIVNKLNDVVGVFAV